MIRLYYGRLRVSVVYRSVTVLWGKKQLDILVYTVEEWMAGNVSFCFTLSTLHSSLPLAVYISQNRNGPIRKYAAKSPANVDSLSYFSICSSAVLPKNSEMTYILLLVISVSVTAYDADEKYPRRNDYTRYYRHV